MLITVRFARKIGPHIYDSLSLTCDAVDWLKGFVVEVNEMKEGKPSFFAQKVIGIIGASNLKKPNAPLLHMNRCQPVLLPSESIRTGALELSF
ncbi:hypothetical protein [Cytobacillus oceanisediminis]|uniref:Uncharacterized protein n=1 Tax=Cytobacillus oceanisediminis 2691 TaxID=1196031 RepID=A0A160MCX2_9BACI|nr:hypothetical protein [Cytobacillus oceanisediminis]AND40513.1 hypothetical protein A361_15600 [Cytobacillus oceanisediminis 2691]MCM3406016.1 hypothetical protein [Cytobacillus oceanisediminis]MDK7666268.1 hypothetical protein [Cytobacillus oceanisediminis]